VLVTLPLTWRLRPILRQIAAPGLRDDIVAMALDNPSGRL
jgi:hypothetical protein